MGWLRRWGGAGGMGDGKHWESLACFGSREECFEEGREKGLRSLL